MKIKNVKWQLRLESKSKSTKPICFSLHRTETITNFQVFLFNLMKMVHFFMPVSDHRCFYVAAQKCYLLWTLGAFVFIVLT